MTDPDDYLSDYVRKVHQDTQKYLRDLIAENSKLCALIHTLERELDRERRDRLRMEERVASIDAERRAYQERYLEVEAHNANVSNLYVATLRLHRSIDHSDVLSAIQEIIINLVGSEELAIFEMNPQGTGLVLSSSFGIDTTVWQKVPLGVGITGRCAELGESFIAGESPHVRRAATEEHLTACLPLMVAGRVTGAIAIFRLLDHKPMLVPIDHELFALLGTHGATALYCTSLVVENVRLSLRIRAASEAPRE